MGAIKAFKRLKQVSGETDKLQDNLRQFFVPIENCSLVDGVLLRNISLTTGQVNAVKHKLGRELIGYIVTLKNANSEIWDSQSENKLKSTTLNLQCSADVTVDLWVF